MQKVCDDIKELFVLERQEKLNEEQKQKLNEHLLFCPECMCQMVLSEDRVRRGEMVKSD